LKRAVDPAMSDTAEEVARLEERLRLVSEIVRAFAEASTDLHRLLGEIVRRIADSIHDACSLWMLGEDGMTLQMVSRHHVDGLGIDLPGINRNLSLDTQPILGEVLATGEPRLIERLSVETLQSRTTPVAYRLLEQLGIHSLLIVPLRVRARPLGLMMLTRNAPHRPPFDRHDQLLAQNLADHAALTILNARAFEAERQAREALSEADRVLFELSPVAMYVIDRDRLQAAAVNRTALALYGYTQEEFLRLPIEELRSREERDVVRTRLQTISNGGADVSGVTRHRRKDGTFIDLEYWTRPTRFRGRPSLLLVVADISDRLRAQEAQAHLATIIDSSDDAIVTKSLDGTITSWNRGAERVFGYTADEVMGRSILILLPPERQDEEHGILERLVRGEHISHFETVRVRKDGRRIDVSVTISPVYDAHGTLVGAAKVARDMTDRNRLEEQRRRIGALDAENQRIQEASRLKSEFLANMSHELRTPLNAVIGFAALMHGGRVGPVSDTQREYLGDILASSRHLLQLINDVLDLAKIEAGRMVLNPETILVEPVIGEVRDILAGMADEKQLSVSLHIDPAMAEVVSDERALKQILYNYLSNAIKFTPRGGAVAIRVVPDGPAHFLIEVADTGIGVKAEDIPRLFVEFEQLDGGVAKRYPGTGLGLALTKRMVEALGGTVSVESQPGQGSCFSARLPR
jgi:PAS domain S-box-containing protein